MKKLGDLELDSQCVLGRGWEEQEWSCQSPAVHKATGLPPRPASPPKAPLRTTA